MSISGYSKTGASNTTVGGVDYSEGHAANLVNNGVRGLTGEIAQYRDDLGGELTAGGTVNALTLTTNQGISLKDGEMLGFVAGAENTGPATLNVDSLGTRAIRKGGDKALASGDIQAGGHYLVQYDASANGAVGAWMLLNPDFPEIEGGLTSVDLGLTQAASTVTITNTGGDNVDIPAATASLAGLLSAADKAALDAAAAQAVDLAYTRNSTSLTVTNTGGDDVTLPAASTTLAGVMTASENSKLTGIETGATRDQTAGEIKSLYESNSNTNAFTDADHFKLNTVETGATADQSDGEIIAANGSANVGDVGTYALLLWILSESNPPGTLRSGSNLFYSNASAGGGQSPAGTWRCMGHTGTGTNEDKTTVWLRVA